MTLPKEVRTASPRAKAGIFAGLALVAVEVMGMAVWWTCDHTFVGELALRATAHLVEEHEA